MLKTSGAVLPSVPHVHLRPLQGGPETPVQKPSSPDIPVLPPQSGRYQRTGETARGGMGAIL